MLNHAETPRILIDKDSQNRYDYLVSQAQIYFSGTALLTQLQPITETECSIVRVFNSNASPTNSFPEYRRTPVDQLQPEQSIIDASSFDNWNKPGGPSEHVRLASEFAFKAVEFVNSIESFSHPLNPHEAFVTAALHDTGRLITHIYHTNDRIGTRLLKRIGVRQDIIENMPDEDVMLTPMDEDMETVIENLTPMAVIIRIADEFGKRVPNTNQLYKPRNYTNWDRDSWANGYMQKPFSGRPTDNYMRQNDPRLIEKGIDKTRIQLHVDNVPRYFDALNTWTTIHVGMRLHEFVEIVGANLEKQLSPLQEQ